MTAYLETQEIPVRKGADIIVAGGGFAGVAAAIAARRAGAEVLLLEKTALFGGLGTNGLISWFEPLCDGEGHQLIYGLAEELLRTSIRYGDDTLPQIWQLPGQPISPEKLSPQKKDPVGGRYASFYSPTLCQLALDELLLKEGVQLRLDILATRPVMEGRRCVGIICESKSGRELYTAQAFVDATGDADLFSRAGCHCVLGENFFSFIAHLSDTSEKETALGNRRWSGCGADLFGEGHPQGYPHPSGTTNEEITRFLLDGRMAMLDKLRGSNRHQLDIASLPTQAQFRKTRRIAGAKTLREEACRREQPDSVGLMGDFVRPGDWYELPFGTLYSPEAENLLAAGRMISSEGWAWDVTRVIPCCALTGQAAGIAAALIAARGASVQNLSVEDVQNAVMAQGVRIHHGQITDRSVQP